MQRGIDVHSHVVPENFPSYIGAKVPALWPSMAPAHACHRSVMIEGKNYRTVSDLSWDAGKRIVEIGEMGLERQVISPMPELLSYWFDAHDAWQLLRYINEQIAGMVAASDGRLLGMGGVPLQDMDLAIRELESLMRSGFVGVELGSNVNGKPLGDPSLDPFFEACVALDAAVFIHALRPTGMDRVVGPPALQQVLGYPTDVGLCAASMLTTNLIERRPQLRIAFSHGGGTLGSLLPRLEQGFRVFPAVKESIAASPTAQARKFFYDDLVFSATTLRHLIDTFGASQLLVGTDCPYPFGDKTPIASLDACGLEPDVAEQILFRNAERYLNRP